MIKGNLTNFHHGIGSVGDLPIPFETVLNVAAWVIILTFVFLKVSWKESILTSEEKLFDNKQGPIGKSLGALILFLLIAPGLIGNEEPTTSIAPLILWVFLWIGVPVLGLLFGDLYAKFNPLNIIISNDKKPESVYLASFLFLGLTWFELVWRKPGNPFHIGVMFLLLFIVVNCLKFFFNKTWIQCF